MSAWLGSRRVLLVLDNLEHLRGVESVVAELLVGEVVVVATSRAPLHLSAERELPVEPLPDEAAVELFVSRAAAAGREVEADATVAEVCRRLDNLPLALELAAARAKLLSPAALLERLDAALPLLSGGARDLPERQRTLRATIEWSHDLLDHDAQVAFRRLSVFRGSFTLEAAEAITGAGPRPDRVPCSIRACSNRSATIASSCSRRCASTHANGSTHAGETNEYALRHARYYLERLESRTSSADAEEPNCWPGSALEEDNLRAMLDRLMVADVADAARAAVVVCREWYWRGANALSEARRWIDALLKCDGLPDQERVRLLILLAQVSDRTRDFDAAEAAARAALAWPRLELPSE